MECAMECIHLSTSTQLYRALAAANVMQNDQKAKAKETKRKKAKEKKKEEEIFSHFTFSIFTHAFYLFLSSSSSSAIFAPFLSSSIIVAECSFNIVLQTCICYTRLQLGYISSSFLF